MAQGLLLREHGYQCDHGVLYFAGSRTRVRIDFTPELETRTRELLELARAATRATILPPPLENSPKCNGCSLAGICLPDETNALLHSPADSSAKISVDGRPTRRLYPVRDDATPFYVQEQGAMVGCAKQRIVVKKSGEELASIKLQDVSQLVLCGNVQISTQCVQVLCEASIPVVYLSTGHWFYGIAHGIHLRNAYDRAAQFKFAADPRECLSFARRLVADKAENQRTLLRRNAPSDPATDRCWRTWTIWLGASREWNQLRRCWGSKGRSRRPTSGGSRPCSSHATLMPSGILTAKPASAAGAGHHGAVPARHRRFGGHLRDQYRHGATLQL